MARRLILFTLALVLALGGTGAVLLYASNADARALAGQETVEVLVASAEVAAGARAEEVKDKVELTTLPRTAVPAAAMTDLDATAGSVVATNLYPGQVLVPAMFTADLTAQKVTPLPIPDGQVAVSVALDDPTRVAGFVQPGSEVAVFTTYNADEALGRGDDASAGGLTGPSVTTRLVLPRALVLAVATTPVGPPQESEEGEEAGSGAAASGGATVSVTLALSQADAERMIQVAQAGSPYLALLNPKSQTALSGGIDNRTLLG